MENLSFKGVYAIPITKQQNPTRTDYKKFLENTYVLRDKSEKSSYSQDEKKYYVYIQDKCDRTFEQLAKFYEIKADKVDKTAVPKKSVNMSEKMEKFVKEAIDAGAKNTLVSIDKDNSELTLYEDDGKTIFGKYILDKNGTISEVHSYLNGKISHIDTLDKKTGTYKLSKMFNSDGQPICTIKSDILRVV